MNKYFKVFPLILFIIFSFIACDGNNGGNSSITQTIGPNGGTIQSADRRLTLEIPPGALTEDTEITIILLHVPGQDDANLLAYEFLPDGLEFQLPARVTVDVDEIIGTTEEGDISFSTLPLIITAEGEDVVTLDDLTLELDADTGSATVQGDIEHFSGVVIGGKVALSGKIDGVPFQNPANSKLPVNGDIIASVTNNLQSPLAILLMTYLDSSLAPVLYKGSINPAILFPTPINNQTQTYIFPYDCGDPGTGVFEAEIRMNVGQRIRTSYTVKEVDIAAAFTFTLLGEAVSEERREKVRVVFLDSFSLKGKRTVVCLGPPPTDPPPGTDIVLTTSQDTLNFEGICSSENPAQTQSAMLCLEDPNGVPIQATEINYTIGGTPGEVSVTGSGTEEGLDLMGSVFTGGDGCATVEIGINCTPGVDPIPITFTSADALPVVITITGPGGDGGGQGLCDQIGGTYGALGTVIDDPFGEATFVNDPCPILVEINPDSTVTLTSAAGIDQTGTPTELQNGNCMVDATGTGIQAGFASVDLNTQLEFFLDMVFGNIVYQGTATFAGNPFPAVSFGCTGEKQE